MDKQILRCYIKIDSPVHIGCDEVYEPTGFMLNESEQKLTVFDPFEFISSLEDADKQRFSEICLKGTPSSILEIYKFMQNRSVEGRAVNVCNDFVDHYRRTLSIPINNEKKVNQELNQFQIPRTAYRGIDQRPYIPGSAVKGSLRTAYLNGQAKGAKINLPKGKRAGQILEQRLLDYTGIQDDPFRLVKVSDFQPVGDVGTKIIYAINEKKKMSDKDAGGLPLLFEVLEQGTLFQGTISVEKPLKEAKIKKPISLESLLKCSLMFYGRERKREEIELKTIGVPSSQLSGDPDDQDASMLMRVGRHSGAESITIDGYREISVKVDRRKWKVMDHSTTLWLVSDVRRPRVKKNLQPFGWVKVFESNDENEAKFNEAEDQWHNQRQSHLEMVRLEKERQAKLIQEAKDAEIRMKEEEEKRLQEEAESKAEFEAMSPEERLVIEIKSPDITENRIVEIYNQLDSLSSEHMEKLAAALKEYWIANRKWNKKDCSKKQLAKVQKIRAIVNEG